MKISIKGTSYQSNQTCNSCWEWHSTLFFSRPLENGNSVTCFLERSKTFNKVEKSGYASKKRMQLEIVQLYGVCNNMKHDVTIK